METTDEQALAEEVSERTTCLIEHLIRDVGRLQARDPPGELATDEPAPRDRFDLLVHSYWSCLVYVGVAPAKQMQHAPTTGSASLHVNPAERDELDPLEMRQSDRLLQPDQLDVLMS